MHLCGYVFYGYSVCTINLICLVVSITHPRSCNCQDKGLWEFIGMPYNEMKWFIVAIFEIACKLITLIYISRCQIDSEPLVHMKYTGNIFSYKLFCCDEEYEVFDSNTDWLENLIKVYKLIPR